MRELWKALLLQSWVIQAQVSLVQDRQLFLAVLSWLNPDPPQQGSQGESPSEGAACWETHSPPQPPHSQVYQHSVLPSPSTLVPLTQQPGATEPSLRGQVPQCFNTKKTPGSENTCCWFWRSPVALFH